MSKLDSRIEETKELLEDYDMMPHAPDPAELILKNQIAIMEILKEIQDSLSFSPPRSGPP